MILQADGTPYDQMIRVIPESVPIQPSACFFKRGQNDRQEQGYREENNSTAFTFKLDNKVAKILQKQPNMTAFVEAAILEKDFAAKQKQKQ